MKRQSTIARAMSLKATSPKTEEERTEETTNSEQCHEASAKAHYVRSLVRFAPDMRLLFRKAGLALAKYELEVVRGISDGSSLQDYDEIVMARYSTLLSLLGEIDLRLSLLSHAAIHHDSLQTDRSVDELLQTELKHISKSETH